MSYHRLGRRGHNQRERKRAAQAIITLGITIGCAIAWGWTGGIAGLALSVVVVHFIDHSDAAL